MVKSITTFAMAFLGFILIAGASIRWGPKPMSPLSVITMGLLLTVAFSWVAAYAGLQPKLTLAGLICGAILITLTLIFFDWALRMPPPAILSVTSFGSYLKSCLNPASIAGIATPLIVAIIGFLSGWGLFLALCRREHEPS
jgi:hypothetical protein